MGSSMERASGKGRMKILMKENGNLEKSMGLVFTPTPQAINILEVSGII
jgi:hypothetical protein